LAIRDIAETKPVVAVIGNMGTSADDLVALGGRPHHRPPKLGDRIDWSVDPNRRHHGILGAFGVSAEAIKSSPLKATPSPLETLTPEARQAAQAVVDDIYR